MNETEISLQVAVAQFIYREAQLADNRDWEGWLGLYEEDIEYWVPAWASEDELTADPTNEISLMYITDRQQLQDRVWRFTSGLSPASVVLPRTSHIVGNVIAETIDDGLVRAKSTWLNSVSTSRGLSFYSGFYDHVLKVTGDGFKIQKKKIILNNDAVMTALDLYHL